LDVLCLAQAFERLEVIALFFFGRVTGNPEILAMKREGGRG
jgi:hypothetical protein